MFHALHRNRIANKLVTSETKLGNLRITGSTLSAVVAKSTTALRNALLVQFMCALTIRAVAKVQYPHTTASFTAFVSCREKEKRFHDRLSLLRLFLNSAMLICFKSESLAKSTNVCHFLLTTSFAYACQEVPSSPPSKSFCVFLTTVASSCAIRCDLRVPQNSEFSPAPKQLRFEDILALADATCRRRDRKILTCLLQFRLFRHQCSVTGLVNKSWTSRT